jgi:hypothetical protein
MVNASTPTLPAIGACLQCNQLFLVTDTSAACLICGRPPDLSLPFGHFVPAGEDVDLVPTAPAEEPEAPILIAVKCPHCDNYVQLSITDTEISVVPPPAAPPVEEAASEVIPPSEAAPSPAETPPAPAMAADVFGNPIEGPPVGAPLAAPEEPPG